MIAAIYVLSGASFLLLVPAPGPSWLTMSGLCSSYSVRAQPNLLRVHQVGYRDGMMGTYRIYLVGYSPDGERGAYMLGFCQRIR